MGYPRFSLAISRVLFSLGECQDLPPWVISYGSKFCRRFVGPFGWKETKDDLKIMLRPLLMFLGKLGINGVSGLLIVKGGKGLFHL